MQTTEVGQMRKTASIRDPYSPTKRVMIYESTDGVYLFSFSTNKDGSASSDHWFQTVAEAEEFCSSQYVVNESDWIVIDDPLDGCQHDWIAPVRVKGRDKSNPQWSVYERLEDDVWHEIN